MEDNMLSRKKYFWQLLMMTGLVITIIAACNRPGTEPTLDPNIIFTSAAQTVEAQLTQAVTPQAVDPNAIRTEAAATIMAQMQANQPPTVDASLNTPSLGGATPTLPLLLGTPGAPIIGTLPPIGKLPVLSTATTVLGPSNDKYALVSQNPVDGTRLGQSYDFDMEWVLQNTGTTTWNTQYYIEWFNQSNSNRIGSGPAFYYFKKDVPPNGTITVFADMTTSSSSVSDATSWWAVKNDKGQSFGTINVKLSWGESYLHICCTSPDSEDGTCKGYLKDVGQKAGSVANDFCNLTSCVGDIICD
jgi:hypothetical protein